MRLKFIHSIFILIVMGLLSFGSCVNDNDGFEEYYNPMGNNPVQVVPWLIELKESFYKKEASIYWYELNEKEYYVVKILVSTSDETVNPCTIYEADDKEAIIYYHSDNVLTSEEDEVYKDFVDNATLLGLLWSNERKNSTVEIQ